MVELTVSSQKLRCLLVEDQLMIKDLLAEMLMRLRGVDIVGSAATAAEGIAACAAHRPDLVILDIALPDGNGLDVARALKVLKPDARVIVLSSFASTVEWPLEMSEQLCAIVDKAKAFEDLLEAISPLLPACNAQEKNELIDFDKLTPRERQIILLIGRGLTSQAIAQELCISLRTVETHRHNICRKLGLSGSALIRQATLLEQFGKDFIAD